MISDTYYPPHREHTTRDLSHLGSAALGYASRGLPVFPVHEVDDTGKCSCREGASCEGPGKHPRIKNNLVSATTDPDQIRLWWRRWPNANIAVVTGKRSRLLVVDKDPAKGGDVSMAKLEAKHGPLTNTAQNRTGGDDDGRHYIYQYKNEAEIRNSAGKLGPGLDVRGEGGYIIVPPSRTTGAYETLETEPLAELPEALLKALTEDPRAASNPVASGILSAQTRGKRKIVQDDGPIPEGMRNLTLIKYGGRLRAWGREEEEILEILRLINERRCSPPLSDKEVAGIARSVARYPAGTAKGATRKAGPEVADAVNIISRTLLNHREWRGVGGKTERSVVAVLTMLALKYGELIPTGVRLEVSYRDLALMAATSLRTITRVIQRLKEKGILRADNYNRIKEEAGALVLLHPGQGVHTPTMKAPPLLVGVDTLTTPRLRNSAPGIIRLGKSCEAAIDHLAASGGSLNVETLDELMGSSCPRYTKRQIIPRLVDSRIATLSGSVVSLTPDWQSEVERERERAGEVAAYWRDVYLYERQRTAYKNRDRHVAEPVPETPPDGEEGEPDLVSDSPTPPDLSPEDLEAVESVLAWERVRGPFGFSRSEWKELFYTGPIPGVWPDSEVSDRVAAYLGRLSIAS